MFELQNIRFLNVLHVPTLTIHEGDITCIVGESGAGKSTLAKLLNKMNSPTEGTITYKGRDLKEMDAVTLRRDVVMLSQTPLIVEGTIRDNLQLGLHYAEKREATEEEMMRVLQEMRLTQSLEDDVATLSGGEKQRIALARVALMNPSVLILDEPTSALDDHTEEDVMRQFLRNAKQAGQTIIIITHSKALAEEVSDRIITVKAGEIID